MHFYEVRPRKDKPGVDLISDVLPFGRLWYGKVDDAIGYAEHYSRSDNAVIRVFDGAGDVIETHERKGDFKEWQRKFCSRFRVTRDFHQRSQRDVPSLSNRMKVTSAVPEWGEAAVLDSPLALQMNRCRCDR